MISGRTLPFFKESQELEFCGQKGREVWDYNYFLPFQSPFAYDNVLSDFIIGQACLPEGRVDKARMERWWLFGAHPPLDAILWWKIIYDFQRGN
jgi:hypothetical protein